MVFQKNNDNKTREKGNLKKISSRHWIILYLVKL